MDGLVAFFRPAASTALLLLRGQNVVVTSVYRLNVYWGVICFCLQPKIIIKFKSDPFYDWGESVYIYFCEPHLRKLSIKSS